MPIRCLTIDVEEYYHIEAAHGRVQRDDWPRWPSRVEVGMDRLLELLDRLGRRATFFFLGHVAQQHPHLAKRCAAAGHEVASHGSMHDRLHRLNPASFREDLLASKHLLEDQTGQAVVGYRAPTWSITRQTAWALDVLAEAGFRYDASIFPVRHPWYGVPDAPYQPFRAQSAPGRPAVLELPPLVWRVAGRSWPAAGGGYFRLLPLGLMRRGLMQAQREGRPAILYFHPWEFDPDLPRLPLGVLGCLRTYSGLGRSLSRLERLLRLPGTWQPLVHHLDSFEAMAQQTGDWPLQPGDAAGLR
ncbi:MAG TPA: XrtA system polysaccharide deacetylase [Phycisphaeraceae bacterium]